MPQFRSEIIHQHSNISIPIGKSETVQTIRKGVFNSTKATIIKLIISYYYQCGSGITPYFFFGAGITPYFKPKERPIDSL